MFFFFLAVVCKKFLPPSCFFFYYFGICHTWMIQIIKQILILHKDNLSKYKMQFWNSDFILPWNFPIDAVSAQSLSYCWIMNTDLNWSKWGLPFFRCCSGFFYDLLDESSLRSWSNFGRPATPGRFTTVPSFLHLWIMALTVVRWSPKVLEMAL